MLVLSLLGTGPGGVDSEGADLGAGFGQPGEIGKLLLTKFLLPFEVASFLLLVAAVGAVVLARRRGGLEGGPDGGLTVADLFRVPSAPARCARASAGRRARTPAPARRPKPCRRTNAVNAEDFVFGRDRVAGRRARGAGGASVNIGWYLAVSAIVFCIGAGGVLTRRNPLVILLCLELMLNAANLALIAFSRMHGNGDGQIFAIIVMVVAACEVTVGLGVIVAMYRRRLPIDVDELRALQG